MTWCLLWYPQWFLLTVLLGSARVQDNATYDLWQGVNCCMCSVNGIPFVFLTTPSSTLTIVLFLRPAILFPESWHYYYQLCPGKSWLERRGSRASLVTFWSAIGFTFTQLQSAFCDNQIFLVYIRIPFIIRSIRLLNKEENLISNSPLRYMSMCSMIFNWLHKQSVCYRCYFPGRALREGSFSQFVCVGVALLCYHS